MSSIFHACHTHTFQKSKNQRKTAHRWRSLLTVTALLAMAVSPAVPQNSIAKQTEEETGLAAIRRGDEIVLLSSYAENLRVGGSTTLVASSTGGVEIRWRSSDDRIATVDDAGVVTAVQAGTCQILAQSADAQASCTVTVEKTSIVLNANAVKMRRKSHAKLQASVSSGRPVTWSSSKPTVATVDQNGRITARKRGMTHIIASADGVTVGCRVKVTR